MIILNENFRNVSINLSTKEKLDILAERSNLSKSALLKIIIDTLFSIGVNFKHFSLDYDYSVSEKAVYFYFHGKSLLVHGKANVSSQLESEFMHKELQKESEQN